MMPASFEYARAASVAEAIVLLRKHGADAKLLAGGHSLVPMMKLRLARPGVLVDIGRLRELAGIKHEGGRFTIGALTTHAALAASKELEKRAPALWDAANHLGDPQVRNRGTIGGACAHADPSADYPAVMLALDARLHVEGQKGKREIPADEFFVGTFETALGDSDILTAISFADAPNSAYAKFRHPASHYAVVGVAVNLTLKSGAIAASRLAVTGVGDAAFRATAAEKALAGVKADDGAAARRVCSGMAAGVEVRGDVFASADYRKAMTEVFAARAIRIALNRA